MSCFSLVYVQSHFDEFMYFNNDMYPKVQESQRESYRNFVD